MSRLWKRILISVAILLSIFIAFFQIVSGDRTRLVPLANSISLGDTYVDVEEVALIHSKVSHQKAERWSIFTTGLASEWLLLVHYTNDVVDFVGIVESDQLTVNPQDAPRWKAADGFHFEAAIREGISFAK